MLSIKNRCWQVQSSFNCRHIDITLVPTQNSDSTRGIPRALLRNITALELRSQVFLPLIHIKSRCPQTPEGRAPVGVAYSVTLSRVVNCEPYLRVGVQTLGDMTASRSMTRTAQNTKLNRSRQTDATHTESKKKRRSSRLRWQPLQLDHRRVSVKINRKRSVGK